MSGDNSVVTTRDDPATTELRLLDGRVLRGCNVHHRSTVYVQRVHLGELEGHRTGPEFAARFVDRFGGLRTLAEDGLRAGFLAKLHGTSGVSIESALLEAIRAVELAVAFAMQRLDTLEFTTLVREPAPGRVVELVWDCHSGSLSRAAARAALAGVQELIPASGSNPGGLRDDFTALFRKLQRKARRRQWSTTTALLALAARERGVPFEPLAGAHLRLGDGVMQHVVSASTPGLAVAPAVASVTRDQLRDAGRAALESILPAGVTAGVPTAVVLGDRGASALARDLDGLLRASGSAVGLATRKLITIAGKPVDPASLGRGASERFLLADPRVETLVCAVSPRKVVARGLRLERSTVTAILDPPQGRVAHRDRIAVAVCLAATTGVIVASADHTDALQLADELDPKRLVLVAPQELSSVVIRHLASGGWAVVRAVIGSTQLIELRHGSETVASVPVASLRPSANGIPERRILRAMFMTALAFGLGLSGLEIVAAIEKRRYFRR